jgi:hypothetical protein
MTIQERIVDKIAELWATGSPPSGCPATLELERQFDLASSQLPSAIATWSEDFPLFDPRRTDLPQQVPDTLDQRWLRIGFEFRAKGASGQRASLACDPMVSYLSKLAGPTGQAGSSFNKLASRIVLGRMAKVLASRDRAYVYVGVELWVRYQHLINDAETWA